MFRTLDGYPVTVISDEYTMRKRRVKKKGKGNKNYRTSPRNIEESDVNKKEIDNDQSSTHDDSNDDNDDTTTETDNEPVNFVDNSEEVDRSVEVITVDGYMKAPPQIILEPEPLDKILIYDEKLDIPDELEEETKFTEFNRRALSKHASTYELEKFEKNCLIIFNQENVDGYKRRRGTEKDVQSLKNTFSKFGFEITEHKDFTKEEVLRELKTFSERDFTDYGCVAVAVLTHGSHYGLLRAKDQPYSEIEIINHFKVYDKPTLVTKPKVLIIQACRGKSEMQGVAVLRSGKIRRDFDESLEPYTLPAESDMLILHSSYIGHPSHRDELHGSWFVQALCHKIDQLSATHDLESIITEVKREVAVEKYHEEYNRRTLEMDVNKQMPVTTSTLIRKLYLKRYGEESSKNMPQYSNEVFSNNEVLDSSMPSTPLLVHFGPCSCFLDHFAYVQRCLSYYVDENPNDETARTFLDLSETFENTIEFNNSKRIMSKKICSYLDKHAKDMYYYKYLYFYKHEHD